jgi:hypothetical protein
MPNKLVAAAALVWITGCGKTVADDWTSRPTKAFTGTVGDIHYQVTAPADWVAVVEGFAQGWQAPGDQKHKPRVVFMDESLKGDQLDDAISATDARPEYLVRKDKRADGFALTEVDDQTLVRVHVFKKVPSGRYVHCTSHESNLDGIANFDGVKHALEAICDSFVLK